MHDTLELFTHTGDGVWAVDAEHRIVVWSLAAQDGLGYSPEEVIGRPRYQLKPICCSVIQPRDWPCRRRT